MSAVVELSQWLSDERTAALVTSDLSVRHLCGFGLNCGLVLATKEESFLFVGESEYERAKSKSEGLTVVVYNGIEQILDLLIKLNIRRVYVESDKMTVRELNYYADELHCAELIKDDKLSEKLALLRTVKSENELKAVQRAQIVCDRAYHKLIMNIRRGMSERQIAAMLAGYLFEYGADEIMPKFRVAAGENSAKRYSKPSDRKTQNGDFVIIDFGARVCGYCASMARTVVVGEIIPKRENVYNAVSGAFSDGLKALRGGIGAKVAESVVQATLSTFEIDSYAKADFGHGTGLEFSEPPYLKRSSPLMLRKNMTLVCGVELNAPGRFGVKIADCVAVTEEGCANFTDASKSLIHI